MNKPEFKPLRLRPEDRAVPSICAHCVHGYDIHPRLNSLVFCGPQKKVHKATYGCAGFCRITAKEIDKRTVAKFAKPSA